MHWFFQLLMALCLFLLFTAGCQTAPNTVQPSRDLVEVNTAINSQGQPCPRDYCLDDWPEATDLELLEYWDCKAYTVAKANRLIRQYGYDPARLEYLLVSGSPLRVTHAALLVDGFWVLDIGLRCQLCTLERFVAGLNITGRLPVIDLPYARQALRMAPISPAP